jgi:hypothetical protein
MSRFKWYRRLKGGDWYYVYEYVRRPNYGPVTVVNKWTRTPTRYSWGMNILREEHY